MREAAAAWMAFASRDLEAARLLVGNEYVANVVSFHAQQCVEKCLKALLEETGADIPRIHSIVKLLDLLSAETQQSLGIDEEDLDLVDSVYTDTRYPNSLGLLPSGFPSRESAKKLLAIAAIVYERTDQALKK
jgi:HEPN domain-containing protein